MQDQSEVTRLLSAWSEGDREAFDRLFSLLYQQLRHLAHARLCHERRDHTLNTAGLVHEAYLELVDINRIQWHDRAHFLAMASKVMRRVLVDYAERRRTLKRGGDWNRVVLDEALLPPEAPVPDVLAFDEMLKHLEAIDPRCSQAIECRYFGGLELAEIAEVLGVSPTTVKRLLRFARAWLYKEVQRELHA